VVASAPSSLFRQPRYRGTSARWHVAVRRLPAGAWLLALALTGSGCSLSYQLDTMLAKKDGSGADQADSPRPAASKATAETPAEGDLVIARAAVSEVMIKGGNHSSVPWENPKTGARGTVTPLASVYSQDGITCRDFLASYVKNGSESWLQGAACRAKRGKWEVRNLRPWNNT
jgi:17 kDa outer membrane surface antigen